jgi:hypothetical protein
VKRIHVVGCPRSGTTLVHELLLACWAIDGRTAVETSIFQALRVPDERYAVLCTKLPLDVLAARPLLALEPELTVVYVRRDPRDVVVSRHPQAPDRYWTNLRTWRRVEGAAARLAAHPRFVVVRYEDVVREPERAQACLAARLPFLTRTASFAELVAHARPSAESARALGGLRALDARGIGAWRRHKPRLVAQMARHGSLAPALIALGYEHDDAWTAELAGVAPDERPGFWREDPPWTRLLRRRALRWASVARVALRRRVLGRR